MSFAKGDEWFYHFHPGMRQLLAIAQRVFGDRNARGMPNTKKLKLRERIKRGARPHLREAIRYARKSRDALISGEGARHEHQLALACLHLAIAAAEFRQPFMED